MTSWKVLLKVSLAWLLSFYCYNAIAGPNSNYNDFTWNNDIDFYADSYLEANPEAVMTDWHWMISGDPNNGDTTDDGFCFMFYNGGDPYAVYNNIQPSQCAFYNNPDYANAEYLSFFDLNLIETPFEYVEGEIYSTDDLINDSYQNWSGACYVLDAGWAGTSGGDCVSLSTDGTIRYGYVQHTLTNIAAIDQALQGVGLETTGYTYSWNLKNADANNESTNGARGQDPLILTVKIKDSQNNVVFEKSYDYSYHIDNWTTFSGSEEFVNPFDLDSLSEIQLDVTGQDAGYWAGYYGPEARYFDIRLQYRLKAEEDTTVEDLLFDQMCQQDPLYDMMCPGYQQAMLDAIAEPSGTNEFFGDGTNLLVNADADLGANEFDNLADPLVINEPAAANDVAADDPSGLTEEITGMDAQATDASNEADNTTGTIVEEVAVVEELATEEAVTEELAAEEPAEEIEEQEAIAEEQSTSGSSGGSRLNATQLAALDAANNAATAAISVAGEQSQISASVGLSETGGVSSTLTSDGVTNEQGVTGSMANIIAGTPGGTNSLSFSAQDTSSGTISSQQLSQDTASGDTTAQSGGAVIASTIETEQQSVQRLESNDQSQTMNIDGSTTDSQMFVFDNNQEQSADSFVDFADPTELTQSFELQDFTGTVDTGVATAENQDFGLEQQLADQSYVEQNDADSMQDAINTIEMYVASADDQQIDISTLTGSEDNSNGIPDELMQTEIFDFAEGEITGTQQDFATNEQIITGMEQQEQNTGEEFAVIDAVETEDITGEEALAQANELAEQASLENMLPTVNTIPMLSELDFVGRFVADFVASLPELPPAQEAETKTEEEQRLEEFREAMLLAKAENGDDSEDAKAAQLGYNPNFGAYATMQLSDSQFYKDKEIYTNKKNYDNPNSRLFDAASDQRHKELVDLQYNKEN